MTGSLPARAEINEVAAATGDAQKTAYENRIQEYMTRPAFANQMFLFWRDTFKTGGATAAFDPVNDTAPAFAAELAVNNSSYMDLFTRPSANCPTFNPSTGTFIDEECTNGGPKAGVLTNPGLMKQFFSNLAMRRGRFVQETFDCLRFPVEISTTPTNVGGSAPYIGVWPFTSIASPTNGGGRVNFQDVTAAICADCHQTLNHIAPLFANYDATGAFQTTIQVPVPVQGNPIAQMADWLPPGETTAWRFQKPAADIPELGALMAVDPAVAQCGVARAWNFALGKEDIVDQMVSVPPATIQAQVDAFTANGFKVKDMIFSVFTADAFVKFATSPGDPATTRGTPTPIAPPPAGPSSGDVVSTFDHDNNGVSAWDLIDRFMKEGPPSVSSQMHGCTKPRYTTLGNVLTSVGINIASTTNLSAGQLYSSGAAVMGAPNYSARVRENLAVTTSGASREFDIFAAGAAEIIANVPTLARCNVGGVPATLFDASGQCQASGITCIIGVPATQDHVDLCNLTISGASSSSIGKRLVVAALMAAAYTCE